MKPVYTLLICPCMAIAPLIGAMVADPTLVRADPIIFFDNPNTIEGNGTGNLEDGKRLTFHVNLIAASPAIVSVDYRSEDRTAMSGADYVPVQGTLNFNPGETVKEITVQVLGDLLIEPTELLGLNFSNPVNATLPSTISIASIVDDDTPALATILVNDVSIMRGLSGTKAMKFPLSLNAARALPISVTASTTPLTAVPGADYESRTETITFAPGETTKEFVVTIYGDPSLVPDKIFLVNFSDTTAKLSRASVFGILKYSQ